MKGFRTFLVRGNVIDLAVAVVMGVAFNAIVQALVKYIITPLIAAAGGTPNFSALKIGIGSTTIDYGLLLNAVISFIIIAAVVYFLIVAPAGKVMAFSQRKKEAIERECPECLSMIPVKASRCKYCTATVPPTTTPTAPVAAR
ncbi:MAG TPA: large conductance mechanosensitive channel protein MscL [Streptosporangiaceae bacterium]|nr:large conductance mechanosensitive channel protein MscL [Streptosporangiaceae bacterium]